MLRHLARQRRPGGVQRPEVHARSGQWGRLESPCHGRHIERLDLIVLVEEEQKRTLGTCSSNVAGKALATLGRRVDDSDLQAIHETEGDLTRTVSGPVVGDDHLESRCIALVTERPELVAQPPLAVERRYHDADRRLGCVDHWMTRPDHRGSDVSGPLVSGRGKWS